MKTSFRSAIVAALGFIGLAASAAADTASAVVSKPFPNIVFILADDLGYGDVGCYNPEAKAPTPNLDRLAKEGLLFADAHSPSTVCTPSRYDTPDLAPYALEEKSPDAPGQLYDLDQNPGETNNLYFKHPEVVKRLKAKLDQAKKSGRGVPQPNTIPQTK